MLYRPRLGWSREKKGKGEERKRPLPLHSGITGVAFAGVARLPSGLLKKKWPSPETLAVREPTQRTCATAWVSLGCVRTTLRVQIDWSCDT